jgi:hypothetical protein
MIPKQLNLERGARIAVVEAQNDDVGTISPLSILASWGMVMRKNRREPIRLLAPATLHQDCIKLSTPRRSHKQAGDALEGRNITR